MIGQSGYDVGAALRNPEQRQNEVMSELAQSVFERNNPVYQVFKTLKLYIEEFQAALDADHEVGAHLVSFGQQVTLHVQSVGYALPSIITFDGLTESRNRVKLVQHVSQLSFLLIAVKKLGETPRRIGFIDTDGR